EPRVVPVREPGHDHLVEVAQHRLERLSMLRRRGGQLRAHVARPDPRGDGELRDAAEERVGPVGGRIEVVAEAHLGRGLRSFSICLHDRVLSTSSFVSQARRACPTPSSTNSSAPVSCASESITIFKPASRAARAWTSLKSSRSGCESISRKVPVSSAFSTIRSMSTCDAARLPIFLFVT